MLFYDCKMHYVNFQVRNASHGNLTLTTTTLDVSPSIADFYAVKNGSVRRRHGPTTPCSRRSPSIRRRNRQIPVRCVLLAPPSPSRACLAGTEAGRLRTVRLQERVRGDVAAGKVITGARSQSCVVQRKRNAREREMNVTASSRTNGIVGLKCPASFGPPPHQGPQTNKPLLPTASSAAGARLCTQPPC